MLFQEGWRKGTTGIILGLILFPMMTQAQQPYDITLCVSGTVTMISSDKELTVFSAEVKGIIQSNHENRIFDNCTTHGSGVVLITGGKKTGVSYPKIMDPDGDFIVEEHTLAGEAVANKILYGTGKWKGIIGEGKITPLTRGKPITPGTFQNCGRSTGTFELPKR